MTADAEELRNQLERELDNDEEDNFIFYRDREEWSNFTPIPQNDGPHPVVKIDYSEKFQDVYDYFRGALKSKEKSQRVLALTTDAIILNAANYTVWQYRREVLSALNIPSLVTKDGFSSEFNLEITFSGDMIEEHQKNYQVWHHRKMLICWAAGYDEDKRDKKMALECPKAKEFLISKELKLTEVILEKDPKNYHAWQHRQWILITFNCFENELNYIDFLLAEDPRNNSAWNQRYFVISNSTTREPALIEKEIQYTVTRILTAPSNESPWSYLKGLFGLNKEVVLAKHDGVYEKCKELYRGSTFSVPMLHFMIDIVEERIKFNLASQEMINQVVEICDLLSDKIDIFRENYWKYLKTRIISNYEKIQDSRFNNVTNIE